VLQQRCGDGPESDELEAWVTATTTNQTGVILWRGSWRWSRGDNPHSFTGGFHYNCPRKETQGKSKDRLRPVPLWLEPVGCSRETAAMTQHHRQSSSNSRHLFCQFRRLEG
jgi:hypothetical protein